MRLNFDATKAALWSSALGLTLIAAPFAVRAQSTTIVGYPANFDAVNDTGHDTYGFEIEADGIQTTDITRIFGGSQPGCYIRYCTGTAVAFPGGVYIRWTSPYDPNTQQFTQHTPPVANASIVSGESCWTIGMGAAYANAGCEHFGISTARVPTKVTYRWLIQDPNNPGQLTYIMGTPPVPVGVNPPPPTPVAVQIPHPVINVIPPVQVGGQPAIDFAVQLPPPPPPPPVVIPQWGDAKWVKVYEQEVENEVDLNDLMAGNAVVPDAAAVETPWHLLQTNPNNPNGGVLHSQKQLGTGKHGVVRRYEFYKYTGTYDPSTHEALCAIAECPSPQPGEVGDLIGAQMAAANVETSAVNVTKVGSGTISGTGAKINCGNVCSADVAEGTAVTLKASAPGNGVFSGWSGACTNADPTCLLTIHGDTEVTGTFTTVFNLSIGHAGNGTVSGTPDGAFDTTIDCGRNCSAKYPQGTVVTLTAAPLAGHTFVNWSGACSGTALTCSLTIAKDTQAQANFK